MFTGLVQTRGEVVEVSAASGPGGGARLVVVARGWGGEGEHRPAHGDSIAVNGCCLTVAGAGAGSAGRGWLAFDVVPQTLSMTTLGGWGVGKVVNLEHAVTATTLLGGHLVQGHVDGVGEVVSVDQRDGWRVRVAAPKGVASALVPQGSVAVDGVSLTIARVEGEEFEVALIPVTLQVTTLGELRAGSKVNVEADVIAKQVARVVAAMGVVPARGPAR